MSEILYWIAISWFSIGFLSAVAFIMFMCFEKSGKMSTSGCFLVISLGAAFGYLSFVVMLIHIYEEYIE